MVLVEFFSNINMPFSGIRTVLSQLIFLKKNLVTIEGQQNSVLYQSVEIGADRGTFGST